MNIPFVVGSIIAMLAGVLLYRSIGRFRLAKSSTKWPASKGQLTKMSLWGKRNVGGQMVDANHIQVEYTYEVNKEKYHNGEIAFYTLMYPETCEFESAHSVGSEISVFYNPKQPSQSILITGPRESKPYSDLMISALAAVVGLAVSIAGWFEVIG